jgi:hypothetical protein
MAGPKMPSGQFSLLLRAKLEEHPTENMEGLDLANMQTGVWLRPLSFPPDKLSNFTPFQCLWAVDPTASPKHHSSGKVFPKNDANMFPFHLVDRYMQWHLIRGKLPIGGSCAPPPVGINHPVRFRRGTHRRHISTILNNTATKSATDESSHNWLNKLAPLQKCGNQQAAQSTVMARLC